MANILRIAQGVDVMPLVLEIERHPELWNRHTQRTDIRESPHAGVSDIWLRYNAAGHFTGDMEAFNDEHDSVWYPEAQALPALRAIVFSIMARVQGERLGGVLITRIPPGGHVAPHIDQGWHARYYDKYAVQLKAAPGQAFCYDGEHLVTQPGDVYWFINDVPHWVVNESDSERMTLIVCIKNG